MKIHVGSKNRTKIQAVEDALRLYPKLFPHPAIAGINVEVPLFGHPKNLQETIEAARSSSSASRATKNSALSRGVLLDFLPKKE